LLCSRSTYDEELTAGRGFSQGWTDYATIATWGGNTNDVIVKPSSPGGNGVLTFNSGSKYWKFLGSSTSYFDFDGVNQNTHVGDAVVSFWSTGNLISYIWLEYCKIHQGTTGIPPGQAGVWIVAERAQYITFKNCDIWHNYHYGIILLRTTSYSSYVTVDSCKVHDNGRSGVGLIGSDNIIINSELYNNGNDLWGSNSADAGCGCDTGHDNIYAWNLIHDNKDLGIDINTNCYGNVVFGNIIYDNGWGTGPNSEIQAGIHIHGTGGTSTNHGVIANNVVYSTNLVEASHDRKGGLLMHIGGVDYLDIYNNIIVNANGKAELRIFDTAGSNIIVENNIFWDSGGASTVIIQDYRSGAPRQDYVISDTYDIDYFNANNAWASGNLAVDPSFLNVGSEGSRTAVGFKLQSGSPCIDTGQNVSSEVGSSYDQDYDGNEFDAYVPWERGAYVYVVSGTCTDIDGDGYGVCPDCGIANGCTYDGDDCNDNNININPGATETCGDSIDYDCDGQDSNGFDAGSPCGGGNLALNKPVTASREDWDTQANWTVDGIWDGSYWAAQGTPNWIEVDLGNDYSINEIRVGPFGNYGTGCYYENAWNVKYRASSDSVWSDFSDVVKISGSGNLTGQGINVANGQPPFDDCNNNYKYYNFTFNTAKARYVRYEVTEGDRDGDSNGDEIEVYEAPGTIICDGLYGAKCQSFNRADTNQDGCIDLDELLAFINRWKISSRDVPMPEVMEAIGLWKQGTGC
jgi:hypothetical protein